MATNDMHAAFLRDVQREIEELEAKLGELKVVEKFHSQHVRPHSQHVRPNGQPIAGGGAEAIAATASGSGQKFHHSLKKHEAAQSVLRSVKSAMSAAQIVDVLYEGGYGGGTARKVLYNGIYTALRRRDDLFYEENLKWGLREWQDTPREFELGI